MHALLLEHDGYLLLKLVIGILERIHFYFQTNTFQGVIITDVTRTYYIFTYICGEMEWSGQGTETAIAGFNSNADYYYNHPVNGIPDIGPIISCTNRSMATGMGRNKRQTNLGNGGITGQVPVGVNLEKIAYACTAIADKDDVLFMEISSLEVFENLPECPPTKSQLLLSPEFKEFPPQTGDCHRSVNSYEPDDLMLMLTLQESLEFFTVCCYDIYGWVKNDLFRKCP
jgi:hypothetical protein